MFYLEVKMKDNELFLEEVEILWPNFAGKAGPMNVEGNRNFNILLRDPIRARELQEAGYNVKTVPAVEEGDDDYFHLNVKVRYGGWKDPRVFVVQNGHPTPLTEATISMLDFTPIKYADLVLNAYHWEMGGKTGIKPYLISGYFVADQTKFDLKYSGTPNICIGNHCED